MIAAIVRPLAGTIFGPDPDGLPTWALVILAALALWGAYALVRELAERA